MTSKKPSLLLTILLSGIGAVFLFLSDEETDRVKIVVRDALSPGQLLLSDALNHSQKSIQKLRRRPADHTAEIDHLRSRLAERERWNRQLQIRNAFLRKRLADKETTGSPPFPVVASESLLVPELLEAIVLGEENAALWRSGKLIDKGRADGLLESTLVLEDCNPLIDQGSAAGLKTGQAVYAGRIVIGRIALVGRLSSTFEPVTHPNYRGRARLARKTEEGLLFGAGGILAGQGEPLCRLERVNSTVPVSVGDEVYTDTGDGLFPEPMYYGKVVKVKLQPGSPRWEITVKPAASELHPQTVQILRKYINPVRVAGTE
jgi:cell shape-determining protein MreC